MTHQEILFYTPNTCFLRLGVNKYPLYFLSFKQTQPSLCLGPLIEIEFILYDLLYESFFTFIKTPSLPKKISRDKNEENKRGKGTVNMELLEGGSDILGELDNKKYSTPPPPQPPIKIYY